VFIATLGWSRAAYVEFVTDERLTTLFQEDRRIALKVFWCDMLGRRFVLDRPGESLS
jgi:hypothetical protein